MKIFSFLKTTPTLPQINSKFNNDQVTETEPQFQRYHSAPLNVSHDK